MDRIQPFSLEKVLEMSAAVIAERVTENFAE